MSLERMQREGPPEWPERTLGEIADAVHSARLSLKERFPAEFTGRKAVFLEDRTRQRIFIATQRVASLDYAEGNQKTERSTRSVLQSKGGTRDEFVYPEKWQRIFTQRVIDTISNTPNRVHRHEDTAFVEAWKAETERALGN